VRPRARYDRAKRPCLLTHIPARHQVTDYTLRLESDRRCHIEIPLLLTGMVVPTIHAEVDLTAASRRPPLFESHLEAPRVRSA
jgi:hypothetical protein